jgi:hypothetical protein
MSDSIAPLNGLTVLELSSFIAALPGVRPAPVLGADTGSVLSQFLGLTAADLWQLADRGIAGQARS